MAHFFSLFKQKRYMSITKFLSTHKEMKKITYSQITDNIVFLAFFSMHIYTYIYLHFLHYSCFCFKKSGRSSWGPQLHAALTSFHLAFRRTKVSTGLFVNTVAIPLSATRGRRCLLMHICPKASRGEPSDLSFLGIQELAALIKATHS